MNDLSVLRAFQRLYHFAGSRRTLLPLSVLLSVLSALAMLVPFVAIWYALQEVLAVWGTGATTDLTGWGWLAFGAAIGGIVFSFLASLASHMAAFRIEKELRYQAMKKLMQLPLGFLQASSTGKLRKVINDNAALTHSAVAHLIPDSAAVLVALLVTFVSLFLFEPRLGVVCLVPLLSGVWFFSKVMGPAQSGAMSKSMSKYMDSLEAMNSAAVEYVRGIPVVKTFQQTVFSFRKFREAIDDYFRFVMNYALVCRLPMTNFTVSLHSSTLFLVPLGVYLCARANASRALLASLIFYCLLSPLLAFFITKILYSVENVMVALQVLDRIEAVFGAQPLPRPKQPQLPTSYDLEFRNVSFAYPGTAEPVLRNVSFHIPQGESWALVGPSGGGKSTIAALAARFWDVDQGEILLGGVNLRNMNPEALMASLSYVFQDVRLFKTTLQENILAARPDLGAAEAMRAAHFARCDEIIEKLPQGLDTPIGTSGVFLSGGEAQRVALARAIAKDAPLVILDEATAFADPENEALIHQALTILSSQKTTLMIAHRLSSVRDAHRILVVDGGRIVESGRHEELIVAGGLYSRLWFQYQKATQWRVGGEVSA